MLFVPDMPSALPHAPAVDPFARLCEDLQSSGGLVAADALAAMMIFGGQGTGRVARWIVEEQLIAVHWQGGYWIPRFQLCLEKSWICPCLPAVLAELPHAGDSWARAVWFSEVNEALQGARPAEVFASAPERVCEAARLLRFVIDGRTVRVKLQCA